MERVFFVYKFMIYPKLADMRLLLSNKNDNRFFFFKFMKFSEMQVKLIIVKKKKLYFIEINNSNNTFTLFSIKIYS